MATPSAHESNAGDPPAHGAGAWWRRTLGVPLRTASFWAAIGLPLVYVPLLLAEPASTFEFQLVAGLIAIHAVALWTGRTHRRD